MKDRSQDDSTSARHRNRATKACTQCRKARVRCVLDAASSACVPCRNSDLQCIFDDKDGRKCRASVRTVEATLTERIRDLERQLEEERAKARGVNSDATGSASNVWSNQVAGDDGSRDGLSPAATSTKSLAAGGNGGQLRAEDDKIDEDEPASEVLTKLMSSSIRFDMASGRVRYFGSTTHMNVLSKMSSSKRPLRSQGPHWPIALVLKDLGPMTHEYLMSLFWDKHNSVIRLVDREAYYHDQESGAVEYYSTFLHLAMLATGSRYADRSRSDIQPFILTESATSTIHEKTKILGRQEIERPGGIPSIQALQLLAGLEFCCGNDNTGWMFSGMCFRMVYDAGLHIDHNSLGLSERDTQIRHMVLWACLTADRLWSLYLGRPTTLKTTDIAPSCLSYVFGPTLSAESGTQHKDYGTRAYECMLQLMERLGQLCDLRGPRPAQSADSCLQLASIGQQLRDWYTELPPDLMWIEDVTANVPPSYYLLHTQYHAAMILLHRPFIQYNDSMPDGVDVQFEAVCRKTCASSAESITTILERYRATFELAQVFGTAVQHAGTAATAMMGEIVMQEDPIDRSRFLTKLSSLRTTVSLMSKNYRGAGLMVDVIDQFLRNVEKHPSGKGRMSLPLQSAQSASVMGPPPTPSGVRELDQFVIAQGPAMMANPLQQRWRPDSWSVFAPSPAGQLSSAGLPYLPSGLLEGIEEESICFGDVTAGSFEPSVWGPGSMHGYQ